MAVALIHRGIRSQAVQVTFAIDVIHPDTLCVLDHDVERMIVMSPILILEFDEILGVYGSRYELCCHRFLSRLRKYGEVAHTVNLAAIC